PVATAEENPRLNVAILAIGDEAITTDGILSISSIEATDADPATQLYNFKLSGNNTYFANGFAVHNKGDGNTNPESPEHLYLVYEPAANKITAKWTGAAYASGYKFTMYYPDNTQLISQTTSIGDDVSTEAVIHFSTGTFPGGVYTGKVWSIKGSFTTQNSTDQTIDKLVAPSETNLSYDSENDQLKIGWKNNNPDTPALFKVQLLKNGAAFKTYHPATNSQSIASAELAPGTYTATVQHTGQDEFIPSDSGALSNSATKLGLVTDPSIVVDGSNLIVTWTPADSAPNGYDIEILKDGVALPIETTTEATKTINASAFEVGTYTAKVRTAGSSTDVAGNYVDASGTVTKLTAPASITIAYDTATSLIKTTWPTSTPEGGFQIDLIDVDSNSLYTKTVANTEIELDISVTDLTGLSAGIVHSQIIALGGSSSLNSAPTASTESITRIEAPTDVTFVHNTDTKKLDINWLTVEGNNGFNIEIYNTADHTVIITNSVDKDVLTKTIDLDTANAPAGEYQARVQTIATGEGDIDSAFTDSSTPLTRVEAPTDVTFIFNSTTTQLDVDWKTVTGNNGFNIEVYNTADDTVVISKSVGKDVLKKSFDTAEIPTTGDFKARVQTIATDVGNINSAFTDSDASITRLSAPIIGNGSQELDGIVDGKETGPTYGEQYRWNQWTSVRYAYSYTLDGVESSISDWADWHNFIHAGAVFYTVIISEGPTGATWNLYRQFQQGETTSVIQPLNSGILRETVVTAADPLNIQDMGSPEAPASLNAPVDPTITANQNNIVVTWTDTNAPVNGYEVEIFKNGVSLQVVPETEKTATIDASGFEVATYTASVRTAADGGDPSNYVHAKGSVGKLAAPASISLTYDQPNDRIVMTWGTVVSKSGLQLNLIDASSKELHSLQEPANSTGINIQVVDLSYIPAGAFKVRLIALGDATTLNSYLTVSSASLNRHASPQNITFSYDMVLDKFTIGWDVVTGNNGYNIEIVDKATKTIVAATIDAPKDSSAINIPKSSFTGEEGEYTVIMKTTGNTETLNSTTNESSVSVPWPPVIIITQKYHWLPGLIDLPAEISYDVTCNNEADEFLPCFSKNKVEQGGKNPEPDALSWYFSPNRDDYTLEPTYLQIFQKL
ncbi:MAG: hypothetical protein JKY54_11910, partial [Flavobacteriales bacterium]|nr:hypothetical protein [Flavobacteriales bacterium]